ncbi:hypothetical protein SAMN05428948_1100 [Massilia sp. CF038]|nr:hypothetical protein SAMN05428948_1100 [Massilia sp. CF038]
MRKPHPDAFDDVPISHKLYVQLGYAEMFSKQERWEVVETAVEDWMRRNKPGACGEPQFAGYQWKGLFLPHGTVLRTVFGGKNHHCHVEQDQIMYEGKALSPNGFVSTVGGIRRNAWKSIWLLLPDCKHWQLADHLRVRRPAPAPRRTMHSARLPTPPSNTVPRSRPLAPAAPATAPQHEAAPYKPQPAPARAPALAAIPPCKVAAPVRARHGRGNPLFGFPLPGCYRWRDQRLISSTLRVTASVTSRFSPSLTMRCFSSTASTASISFAPRP